MPAVIIRLVAANGGSGQSVTLSVVVRCKIMNELITAFETKIGLVFQDKTLLQRALTHRSYLNEFPNFPLSDNERLEFLGDAVLGFVIAAFLYHRFPEQPEGYLTNMRAALVRRETLADFARQLNLGQYLLMGHGEAESGGRERPATLCAGFEALIGAIYLDAGLTRVDDLLMPLIVPFLNHLQRQANYKDAKSRLQERVQSTRQITPRYQTINAAGPDHLKEFTVQVFLADQVYGEGRGNSKRQAEQLAAIKALERLEQEELDDLRREHD